MPAHSNFYVVAVANGNNVSYLSAAVEEYPSELLLDCHTVRLFDVCILLEIDPYSRRYRTRDQVVLQYYSYCVLEGGP